MSISMSHKYCDLLSSTFSTSVSFWILWALMGCGRCVLYTGLIFTSYDLVLQTVAPAGERSSLFQYAASHKIQDRNKTLCLGVDMR
jgi:hypothetical protein